MGVAESKLLAQNLLGACRKAENEGKVRLDGSVFWNDDTISKTVKNICRHIPQDIRGLSRKSDVKKAIERSHTKLQVPKVVQDLQDKRETLFPAIQTTRDTQITSSFQNIDQDSTLPGLPLEPLARCYITIVRYEDRVELDKIRLRFLYVAFYRLKKNLKEYSGAVSFIADALLSTGSITDPIDIVQDRVRLWVSRGDRYDSLAKDLGGLGVLYLLPDIGGESLWSRQLPKSANNETRISMIQKLKDMGINAEAQNGNLHNTAEEEMAKILAPLKTSLNVVMAQGFSQTTRLIPTQDQPDPEMSSHRRTNVSNNTSQNPCQLAGFQRSIQHSIDCGPLLNWPESGTQREHMVSTPYETSIFQENNPACAREHTPLQNNSNILSSYIITEEPLHETPRNAQQHAHSSPTVANISYQYDPVGPDSSNFSTIMPADHPQVFPLPIATTMTPFNHPMFFPNQLTSTILPMNYPQVFPFQNLTDTSPSTSQAQEGLLCEQETSRLQSTLNDTAAI